MLEQCFLWEKISVNCPAFSLCRPFTYTKLQHTINERHKLKKQNMTMSESVEYVTDMKRIYRTGEGQFYPAHSLFLSLPPSLSFTLWLSHSFISGKGKLRHHIIFIDSDQR